MRAALLAALWLAIATSLVAADGLMAPPPQAKSRPKVTKQAPAKPSPAKPGPSVPAPQVTPGPVAPITAPVEPTFDGPGYEALRQPFWTDDFIEPWVPSDVPRDHWSYEWMSWLAEEGVLRDLFPVEQGPGSAPSRYADEAELAGSPELLRAVQRLTAEGIIVGGKGGSFEATRGITRSELGLIANRTADYLRREHARLALVHPPGPAAELVDLDAAGSRYEFAEALVRTMRCLAPLDQMLHDQLDAPREQWQLPKDVAANHRFAPATYGALHLGLLQARPDGTFGGRDTATRGDVALAFCKLLDMLAPQAAGSP